VLRARGNASVFPASISEEALTATDVAGGRGWLWAREPDVTYPALYEFTAATRTWAWLGGGDHTRRLTGCALMATIADAPPGGRRCSAGASLAFVPATHTLYIVVYVKVLLRAGEFILPRVRRRDLQLWGYDVDGDRGWELLQPYVSAAAGGPPTVSAYGTTDVRLVASGEGLAVWRSPVMGNNRTQEGWRLDLRPPRDGGGRWARLPPLGPVPGALLDMGRDENNQPSWVTGGATPTGLLLHAPGPQAPIYVPPGRRPFTPGVSVAEPIRPVHNWPLTNVDRFLTVDAADGTAAAVERPDVVGEVLGVKRPAPGRAGFLESPPQPLGAAPGYRIGGLTGGALLPAPGGGAVGYIFGGRSARAAYGRTLWRVRFVGMVGDPLELLEE